MAKSRPRKKAKSKPVQPQLSGMPLPPPRGTTRILPIQLQIGDRMTDSTGEWEVVGRPYTTAGGKNTHVRVQRVDRPDTSAIRTYGAHERVGVTRTTAEEGKR